jgi:hypothetical protein
MGGTVSNGPVLHSGGNGIGYGCIQLGTLIDGLAQSLIDIRAQICLHHPVIKYQTAKIIGNCTHNKRSFSKCGEPGGKRRRTHDGSMNESLRVRQKNKKGKGV